MAHRHCMTESLTDTANKARGLMAQFCRVEFQSDQTYAVEFDHKGFLDEMEARSQQMRGEPLSAKELKHLARIVKAYLAERRRAGDVIAS